MDDEDEEEEANKDEEENEDRDEGQAEGFPRDCGDAAQGTVVRIRVVRVARLEKEEE